MSVCNILAPLPSPTLRRDKETKRQRDKMTKNDKNYKKLQKMTKNDKMTNIQIDKQTKTNIHILLNIFPYQASINSSCWIILFKMQGITECILKRIYHSWAQLSSKLFKLISSLNSVEYEIGFRLEGFFLSFFFFIIHLLPKLITSSLLWMMIVLVFIINLMF